jgi:hypothetical protein
MAAAQLRFTQSGSAQGRNLMVLCEDSSLKHFQITKNGLCFHLLLSKFAQHSRSKAKGAKRQHPLENLFI